MAEPALGTLLFYSAFDKPDEWLPHLAAAAPDLAVRVHPDVGDPAAVDYALVWKPPQNFFADFANLKLVINLGAGVDALA
ncbi:MAG: glyoxylate/hydroxypyruvate reductase A, partial [Pseudomonadota bacterium]